MDLTMLLGGFAISVCQAMDANGVLTFISSLDEMADRPTVSPAEAHVFRTVADALKVARPKPRLTVIQGGAA
jgi:uncharacterized tellurite resistance protein B-like protein